MRREESFKNAVSILPPDMRAAFFAMPERQKQGAEEFRLRAGRAPSCLAYGMEQALDFRPVTPRDLDTLLETATRASAHTALAQVSAGFITVRGGCRVGLCGEAAVRDGAVIGLRRLSSVSVRIPREATDCAAGVFQALRKENFPSTLIISPPGGGKTTLLRDLLRLISNSGVRVSLTDERGEAAGVWEGVPEFDVGRCTDVMTGVPKAEAAMMLLRAMNPELLAMDEISTPADAEAVLSAAGCGVRLIATAHAGSVDELEKREVYKRLLTRGIFQKAVTISRRGGERIYEVVDIL